MGRNGQSYGERMAPDAANRREQQKIAQRQSLLSLEEIDQLLAQSEAGVRYLRESLRPMFRLPRYPMRLR